MPTRRDVIRNLVVAVGGTSVLSACGGAVALPTLAPSRSFRFYTADEAALLSRVSDLLLPRTETPGALDVQVPGILDGLMTEWANADTRREHRATLAELGEALNARAGGDFVGADPSTAERALADLDAAAFAGSGGVDGYRGLKGLITQAYFSTEGGAVEELGWVAVPGRWDPCMERGAARG